MNALPGRERRFRAVGAAAAVLLALRPAAAVASGGHHGFDLKVHGLYILDFLVVMVPLLLWLGPKIREYLKTRYAEVKAEIDEAAHAFQEAEARLKESESRLKHLSAEIDALMEEFRKLGEKERDALAHEGAVMSEKIREETDFRLSQAVKSAKIELRRLVVQRSLEMLEKRLSAAGRAPVPEGLVDRFADEVSQAREAGTGGV